MPSKLEHTKKGERERQSEKAQEKNEICVSLNLIKLEHAFVTVVDNSRIAIEIFLVQNSSDKQQMDTQQEIHVW